VGKKVTWGKETKTVSLQEAGTRHLLVDGKRWMAEMLLPAVPGIRRVLQDRLLLAPTREGLALGLRFGVRSVGWLLLTRKDLGKALVKLLLTTE